jgi:hypothetical protein
MKLQFFVLGCAVLALRPQALATSTAKEEARREIEAYFRRVNQDLATKDAVRFREDFGRSITPDFMVVCPDGRKQSKDEILTATLERMPDMVAVKKIATKIERLAIRGTHATVLLRFYARYTLKSSKEEAYEQETRAQIKNLWIRAPQGWKRQRAHILSVKEGSKKKLF